MADEHEKASPSQNTASQSSLCTVIVFLWIVIYMFAGFSCLGVFIYVLFTKYYWLPLLYLTWYMYDRHISERGGRSWRLFRNNVLWKYMADYFPAKLHKTAKLDAEKSYIFAIHPHGIFHVSGFLAFATEALGFSKMFPGIIPHLLILAGQFRFPVYRDCIIPSVGEPIEVEKSSNPSQEEIDGLHEKYVTRLLNLFENHKTKYGLDETTRLAIKD